MKKFKKILAIVMLAMVTVGFMPMIPGVNGVANATDNYYVYNYPNNSTQGNCNDCRCNFFICKDTYNGHWENNETVHSWVCDQGACLTDNHNENGAEGCCSVCGYKPQHKPDPVSYLDADGHTQSCAEYTEVTASTSEVTWNAGWYVVNDDVTISKRITCNGAVHLILVDGKTLTASLGITCTGGSNSFTVYGQSGGTGTLNATGEFFQAGIGGEFKTGGSNITINGGKVIAKGDYNGAGIGGGNQGTGSNITINGGNVTAIGKDGAGIGGGSEGIGSNITINGGNVTASIINQGTGVGIGNGSNATGPSSSIYVADSLVVKAGASANPTEVIAHASNTTDIASLLAGKLYVTIAEQDPISYIDADGQTKTTKSYTEVTASNAGTTWSDGKTYVVKESVAISNTSGDGVTIDGDVKLVLCDGATLTVNGSNYGIYNDDDNLTVYAGSTGSTVSGTGKLVCNGGNCNGMVIGDTLTVNGGIVESTGGEVSNGIYVGETLILNGGYVKAQGGGGVYAGYGISASYKSISVNGGTLIAIGGTGTEHDGLGLSSVGSVSVCTGAVVKMGDDASTATIFKYNSSPIEGSSLSGFYVSISMPEPVAQIGETKYDSVQEAVTAAQKGETVKLLSDVELTETLDIASGKEFTLDLNGKTLDGKNLTAPTKAGEKASVIYVNSGATLTLDDSSTGTPGKITGGKGTGVTSNSKRGGGIFNAGTLNIKKVSITKNVADNGAGVYNEKSSILNMYSGEILYNDSSSNGGGVYVNTSGSFTLKDGNIKNNTAVGNGGGVYVNTSGSFTMNGGTISKNKSTYTVKEKLKAMCAVTIMGSFVMDNGSITENIGGGVYYYYVGPATVEVSGASKITDNTSVIDGSALNVMVTSGKKIKIGAAGLKEGASIGITTVTAPTATAGVAFTSNGTEADKAYFTSDSQAYKLKYVAATEGATPVAAHLELVNYNLNIVSSKTVSISLEKDDMDAAQAIAIAKAGGYGTGSGEATLIAYAKASDFNTSSKYKVITSSNGTDWAEGTDATLDQMKDDLISNDYFVIGTTVNHTHSWTYKDQAKDATIAKDTITATCVNTDSNHSGDLSESLTIVKPAHAVYGDGKSAVATFKDSKTSIGGVSSLPDIKYYKKSSGSYGSALTAAPTDAGDYKAEITVTAGTQSCTAYVEYTIEKADTTVDTPPSASAITYGQALSDSTLSDGKGSVDGSFAWTTATTKPEVSDSGITEYEVTFTPTDTSNYNTSSCNVKLTINPIEIPGSDVKINKIDGTNAKLATISKDDINKAGDTLTIDLTDVKMNGDNKEITQLTLTKDTLKNFVDSTANKLEVKLSSASVILDKTAVEAVKDQAAGSEVKLTIETGSKAEQTLTSAQKKTIAKMKKPVVVLASFESNGIKISNFNGGKAKVFVEYKTLRAIRTWFVAEKGGKDKVNTSYDSKEKIATFETGHFSIYVVETVSSSTTNGVKTGDSSNLMMYLGFLAIALLAITRMLCARVKEK